MVITEEEAYPEISVNLTWQAVYSDKTVNQYNLDGTQNRYDELQREGLTAFHLVDKQGKVVVSIPLGEDKKLFYRMRVSLHFSLGVQERIYIVGWRKKDGAKQIWVVDCEGKVKVYDGFIEKSRWLYPPQFFQSEVV
jgi:hypothetical protein